MDISKVTAQFEKDWNLHLEDLKNLIRIPSVSFENFDPKEVRRCGDAVAKLLKERGLENIEYLEVPGAAPYIYADWMHAPGKPTVLLYAHYDVQPPGRADLWQTPPFEPTTKGKRLYARGAADDKAGIIAQTAAIHSYLKTIGKVPVNLKFIVEGEEEIGSPNLNEFLKRYQKKLHADVLMLSDTTNFDVGWPALTVSLRGLAGFEIEVRALEKTVHSGMWGGPVPDAAMALNKILAALVDANGKIAVPEIVEHIPRLTEKEESFYAEIPFNKEDYAKQVGLAKNVKLHSEGAAAWKAMWREPSLSVNAMQAASRTQAGNVLNDTAWARVTLRLAPGMSPEFCQKALATFIKKQTPWNVDVTLTFEEPNAGWAADAKMYTHKAFVAAEKALEKGYGKKPIKMGCGGSIPFVLPFINFLKGAPALLIGVEDPYTNAHGENESLEIEDFKKSCLSQIFLFDELAK